jgi:hypothetical protein
MDIIAHASAMACRPTGIGARDAGEDMCFPLPVFPSHTPHAQSIVRRTPEATELKERSRY